ncbi:hypothetical protein [Bacterioplanoides sp. SCSIO 12839]|uniref:hypothetical protein n=1 Tax=Bacterioplanoides sp. SCSIO 12839 TaxID=2829569 RepID=UPI0021068654|nr:hypothetical protein [Bacterioplanoides sp. SCSIO 12839]UTW48563.1 hypothetical protein KFF03_01290 [Bacterioplanoides sp. SCSIO 12839]
MKHYWLVVKVKKPEILESVKAAAKKRIPKLLSIVPEFVGVKQLLSDTLLLSFSANNQIFGYGKPYVFTEKSAVMVEGLPTLEKVGISPKDDIPLRILELFKYNDPQDMYRKFGGTWSIAHVNRDLIQVFSDFSGYSSCYYHNSSDLFITGNSAQLVASFIEANLEGKYNWRTMSWLASTTMIWGDQTIYDGVQKLAAGDYLELTRNTNELKIRNFSTNFYTPLYFSSDIQKNAYIEDVLGKMCNKVAWYLGRGIKIHTHLTGGKDTRMILALLMGSGAISNIDKIQTSGDEDNGDVIVARLIAKKLGLDSLHQVNSGNKSRSSADPRKMATRFVYCSNRYEGQLTPFDGGEKVIPRLPGACSLMGGGGEIYRNKLNIDTNNKEENVNALLNAYCRYNKLGLLNDRAIHFQRGYIQDVVQVYKNNHILNQEMKFYIDQRLSNWGAAHFRHGAGGRIPVLIDFDLARYQASTVDNKSEDIHFEIIRHACPELLDIPFLNQRWGGNTLKKADGLGFNIDPIEVPVKKSFPWQFEVYSKVRNLCVEQILENFSGLSPWLSKRQLKAMRAKKIMGEKFNSADIKMIFGLAMAATGYSKESYYIPDHYQRPCKGIVNDMNNEAKVLFSDSWEYDDYNRENENINDWERKFELSI